MQGHRIILGIESSCDDTAAAVVRAQPGRAVGDVLANEVIGQDALRTVVLDLDLPHDRLSFHPPATHAPPAGFASVPARTRGRELWTDVVVEGVALEVAVDTGLSAAGQQVADRLRLVRPAGDRGRRAVLDVVGVRDDGQRGVPVLRDGRQQAGRCRSAHVPEGRPAEPDALGK